MNTEKLIEHLAQSCKPVRRLQPPWIRTAIWLALVAPYVVVIVIAMSPRPDLAAKLGDPRFVIEQSAALLTAIAAAAAALATTIPGFDRRVALLPALPLAVWLGSLGQGCVSAWINATPGGLSLYPDWLCIPATVLIGALPAVVIVVMLRHGAPLAPHLTTALGGLAAAGIGNFGLRLFHQQDASVMVLVWQFGTVFALTAAAAWAGRRLLSWRALLRTELFLETTINNHSISN
jgi:hypothetical protein